MLDAPETSEIQAFIAVVDEGSVSGAAAALALPRATLSRRLSRLEERLGVRLLHRTTRRMNLTEAGETYYGHGRALLAAVVAASAAVRQSTDAPSGLLRVSVPPLLDGPLEKILLDFVDAYPAIELELLASSALLDLRAQKIDVAWRATTDLDPHLIARQLFRTKIGAVASPDYLSRRGMPKGTADLNEHDCLVGFSRGERAATHWPLLDGGKVRVRGRIVSNHVPFLRDAALRGLGIALIPAAFMTDLVDEGRLIPVLPDHLGAISQIALVYPDKRLLKPAVRAFVDHVVENATLLDARAFGTPITRPQHER